MVSTRTKKKTKVSYVERVLGAFSQVQRDHRKHAVHLATLRAQVKKNAEGKKDKLGPNWSQWVSKAVIKLEREGILEPATPSGDVAMTPNGKKAISNARRTLNVSNDISSPAQEGLVWKQVLSRGAKRLRGFADPGDSDNESTPTKGTSPRKRARSSLGTPGKKRISRMTKSELKAELDNMKQQSQVHQLLRGVSPLTEFDDEDAQNAQLREELKDREEEIEKMRRELTTLRQKEANRFATPETSFDFDRPSLPLPAALATCSRDYRGGVLRTQSGSYIPDLSKQPTPAPSSPDREMNSYERNVDAENFDMAFFSESLPVIQQQPARFQTPSMGARTTLTTNDNISVQLERDALIAALKSEIEDLKRQLMEGEAALSKNKTDASAIGEVLSNRVGGLESHIVGCNAVVEALQEENVTLKANFADLEKSWKRSEETAATISQQLRVAESLVGILQSEKVQTVTRLSALESSNEDLLVRSKVDVENAKLANDQLETQINLLTEDLESMKRKESNYRSELDTLTECISRATDETQLLQANNLDLECVVSRLRVDAEEQGRCNASLRNEVEDKNRYADSLCVQLQAAQELAKDLSTRLVGTDSTIASLSQDLLEVENKRTTEGMKMSAQLSELVASLDLARDNIEVGNAQLVAACAGKDAIQLNLERKEADLVTLKSLLEIERKQKSAAEVDLATYIAKTHVLEEELRDVKNSKNLDSATISNLRESFANLRDGQLKLFEELESTIVSAHASTILRPV